MAFVLLCAADMEGCGGAILVFTPNVTCVFPVCIPRRARLRTATAFLRAARVVIMGKTGAVFAKDVLGVPHLHRMYGAYVFMAVRPVIAATVSVRLSTPPVLAESVGGIDPVDIVFRASECMTVALFNAANVEVSLNTNCVHAEEVVGIVAMLEARRACHTVTLTFVGATCESIVRIASGRFTSQIASERFDHQAYLTIITDARGVAVAARVPVFIVAREACAV